MKISMYMLEHWLRNETGSSIIQSGHRQITRARLFTDDCPIEEDCLYVGRMVDFFPNAESKEIMLINCNDMISLISTDIRTTFNQVLAAFDFYNDLEQRLYSAIFKPDPEQCMISACEELLGPTFMFATDYRTIACSRNFREEYVNEYWDYIVKSQTPSLDLVLQMRDSTVAGLFQTNPNMVRFVENNAFPYCHGLINTYYAASGQVLGYLVVSWTSPVTKFHEDITRILMDFLKLVQSAEPVTPETGLYQSTDDLLLSNLLAGSASDQAAFGLKVNHRIGSNHRFCIAICDNGNGHMRRLAKKELVSRWKNCVVTLRGDGIMALFWFTEGIGSVEAVLEEVSVRTQTRWGISNSFGELTNADCFAEQARYGLSEAGQSLGRFCRVAVSYIMTQPIGRFRSLAKHPVVIWLDELGEPGGEDLRNTLREYLLEERSVKRAASRLYVHRNTVTYRIDQIKEQNLVDFEDSYDRHYALLSLLMTD